MVDPEPGTFLGSYRVARLLGRGGMGAVYLAYDTTLRRNVAIKIIDTAADAETARERALREARNAASLNHPNICTVHEVSEAGGRAFIAMEYVDGPSLSERCAAGAVPPDEVLRFGVQAADALAYAHAQGVVHRDLKAANALVTASGQLKIVDFGLARRLGPLVGTATTMASIVAPGSIAGTLYAMAPEQVRGQPADARTDVWALGVLLYELLTGSRPFREDSPTELITSILRDSPAPLPAGIPSSLRRVVERCLEKDAGRRFQSAAEVRAGLEVTPTDRGPSWPRPRAPLTWRIAAAGAVIAAALFIVANAGGVRDRLMGRTAERPATRLAVLPFENLTGDPGQEFLSDGLTDEMITELGRLNPGALLVIGRTSSMRYKHRNVALSQIGQELNVDYVLEGSVKREGTRVRINATLSGTSDQSQRWVESFDQEMAGVLGLQRDVARGVAKALALELLPAVTGSAGDVRTVDPAAYEAYLRGLGHWEKMTPADFDTALQYFDTAIARDPTYAVAHTGAARVWAGRMQMGLVAPRDAAPRMRAAVDKALSLDPGAADAQYLLGAHAAWSSWDWAVAESSFRRALQLNPNFAEARALYSHYLYVVKRPTEAAAEIARAVELDPFNPLIQGLHAVALLLGRMPDAALARARDSLKTAPGSPIALGTVADALHARSKFYEAAEAERTYWTTVGDRALADLLMPSQRRSDYERALRAAAASLGARPGVAETAPMAVVRLYLHAGDVERTLEWLERSYEARDPNVAYVAAHPDYDVLRTDSRFQALLARMNLAR